MAVLESAYAALRAAESDLHLDALDPVAGIRELALFNWRYHVATTFVTPQDHADVGVVAGFSYTFGH